MSASMPNSVPNYVSEDASGKHPALAEEPRLTNCYYHLIRELKGALQPAVQNLALPAGSRVFDYGCSTMRHRHMFPSNVEYIGADMPGNDEAHVILDADGRVPLESATFDAVFSTQVLEHVEDPDLYLSECRRLLKPGGRLLLSTHGTFIFHPCPHDYWRWTYMGLQRVIEKAGFKVTAIRGVCGGIPAVLQYLQDLVSPKLPRLLRPAFIAMIQLLMVASDRLYSPEQRLRNACILLMTAEALPAQPGAQPS
ncbi:MAG: class I SAM-dependent methyltransferase [Stenotrophobium sp.]